MDNVYHALKAQIANGRGGQKKLAGNTYARLEEGTGPEGTDTVIVKYHATDIARITIESITLDNGGYFTSTTKERLNTYCLPSKWGIYQSKRVWYLARNTGEEVERKRFRKVTGYWDYEDMRDIDRPSHYGGAYRAPTWKEYPEPIREEYTYTDYVREEWRYSNGMVIWPETGMVTNIPEPEHLAIVDAATKRMEKRIAKYAALYTNEKVKELAEALQNGGYRGDCFYCQWTDTASGKSAGDAIGDTSHLLSHVMEGYVMSTLAYRALKEVGYREPVIIMGFSGGNTRKAIVKYLRKALVEGVAV